MAPSDLVLYDLSGVAQPWSPSTIRSVFALNYKRLPYRTIYLSYAQIADTLSSLGVEPWRGQEKEDNGAEYTLPALSWRDEKGETQTIMGSDVIAHQLEKWQPEPALGDIDQDQGALAALYAQLRGSRYALRCIVITNVLNHVLEAGDEAGREYFHRTRSEAFGKEINEYAKEHRQEAFEQYAALAKRLGQHLASSHESGPFLNGAQPVYADFHLAGFIAWFEAAGVADDSYESFIAADDTGRLKRHWAADQAYLPQGHGCTWTSKLRDVVLYDIKGAVRPWSPNTLRSHFALAYKQIPYRVEWLAYPDIEAKLRSLGITGWPKESGERFPFTCPALAYTDSETGERKAIMGSVQIAQALEALQPEPSLGDIDPSEPDVADYRAQIAHAWPAFAAIVIPRTLVDVLNDELSKSYFNRTRSEAFGKDVVQHGKESETECWPKHVALAQKLGAYLESKHPTGPFIKGASPIYVDFMLSAVLGWLQATSRNDNSWSRFIEGDMTGRLLRHWQATSAYLPTESQGSTWDVDAHSNLVLYDLQGKVRGWSGNTLKASLALGFKRLPYTTRYLSYPDIKPTLSRLGIKPWPTEAGEMAEYTLPAISWQDPKTCARRALMGSTQIVQQLEKWAPLPSLGTIDNTGDVAAVTALSQDVNTAKAFSVIIRPRCMNAVLAGDDRGQAYFKETRSKRLGMDIDEFARQNESWAWPHWQELARRYGGHLQKSSDGPFIHGEKPVFADLVLASQLYWFKAAGVNDDSFERFLAGDKTGRLQRHLDATYRFLPGKEQGATWHD